jgi:vacuolar iron transporter family protein
VLSICRIVVFLQGSFILFGAIPLLAYVFTFIADYHNVGGQLGIACAVTAITLFVLGAIQAKIIRQTWYKQGLYMLINGGLSAAAAWAIGYGLEKAFDVSESANC